MTANTVFLDRDGTISRAVWRESLGSFGAPLVPDDVRLEEGAAEALLLLKEQGFKLVLVSNQPDAAKGHVTLGDLMRVHERLESLLAAEGVKLDAWRYCYHHPEGVDPKLSVKCICRKPLPGMLADAAAALKIPLAGQWVIGDSDKDIRAGELVMCGGVLIENPDSANRRQGECQPTFTVPTILEAAECLLV